MISDFRRILVTGGAGFVGSHLTDRLVALGHDVIVLDDLSTGFRHNINAAARFVEGDVRDSDLVEKLLEEVDACFHLAAIASVQKCNECWAESHSVNLTSFVGILEKIAASKGGVIPVIYASSAAVYGDTSVFPVTETLPLRPISFYGADKAGCELHAHVAGKNKGVPSFGLRPFNIYGPRQHATSPYSGVITIFKERLKKGEGLTIFGDGKQTRDFIYVGDVIEYLVAALPKASTDAPVCNAATGKETSIFALAHKIATLMGYEAAVSFLPPRPGDISRSVADTTRSQALLNYTAQTDIADGLILITDK